MFPILSTLDDGAKNSKSKFQELLRKLTNMMM
jgi:hypothetical protein